MTGCTTCVYAAEHGWWGDTVTPGRTHHRCCHRTLSARIWHCVACCCSFSRDSRADKHRVDGVCKDPGSLRTNPRDGSPPRSVLVQRTDGVWASPAPDDPLPFWKTQEAVR